MSVYRQGEVLGVGTFTKVFEGWDALLDHPVAIKVLVPPFATHDAFVRAFLEKAVHLLDVTDEHVLASYPVDHGQNPPTVVRELADETLESAVIRSPLEPEEVEEILRQAISGLAAIHRRGLVHGGVKPQNLFRCGGRYKVGDFGPPAVASAPPIPARERRYAAPEVLRGEAGGAESDLYSLGLVGYELLLGPLRLERLAEELTRGAGLIAAGEYRGKVDEIWPLFHAAPGEIPPLHELVPGFPMALSLTLQQMVRKDAATRLGSASQLLASLGPADPSPRAVAVPARAARSGRDAGPSRDRAKELDRPSTAEAGARPARSASAAGRPGPPRQASRGAARGFLPALYAAAGALVVGLFAGSWWLLSSHFLSRQGLGRGLPTSAAQLCPPIAIETAVDREAVVRGLLAMSGGDSSLALELEPPADTMRLPIGSPIRFRLTSSRPGHLLLFVLSADGTLTCFYPNPQRRDLVLSRQGRLVLPLAEDQRAGFALTASEPLGRDLVFALRSDLPLAPPVGRSTSPWAREYPPFEGTTTAARDFAAWVARMVCERPREVELAVRELDVVP